MVISGLQKLTLLDYPGMVACTLFTAGCNFRCPFCHNGDLVRGQVENLPLSYVFDFLKSRKNKLDGVCITGGEPLLQNDIQDFIFEVKQLGFKVKLDTNGSHFDKLNKLLQSKLVDYVAMDIKNTIERYELSTGIMTNVDDVKKSVELLKNGNVDYEFRTTVVNPLNKIEDFSLIAKWLKGSKAYYLQQFRYSEKMLGEGCQPYSKEQMQQILQILKQNGMENVYLRGID